MEQEDKEILNNLGLVHKVVKHYQFRNDAEDLFQVGCIGLIKAVRQFDKSRDTQFSTYAMPKIRGEIGKYIRDTNTVHIPHPKLTSYFQVNKLEDKLKRELTEKELKQFKISRNDINNCENALKYKSLNDVIHSAIGDTNIEFGESIQSEFDLEEIALEELQHKELIKHIRNLPEELRKIMFLRLQDRTQTEIGKMLGINQVQVSRRIRKSIKKLRIKMGGSLNEV